MATAVLPSAVALVGKLGAAAPARFRYHSLCISANNLSIFLVHDPVFIDFQKVIKTQKTPCLLVLATLL
ncbi:hypothetical protein QE439_000599 [Pedobacter agri]|nr:hypothetical protein [Pedobacter agri]